jgi:diacylglycerol O-acyltransferase / wax synthase
MEQLTMLDAGSPQTGHSDHVSFVLSIMGDFDAAPDADELANCIERAVARLTAISASHWRSTPVETFALAQGG